jgi:hypothetical protein
MALLLRSGQEWNTNKMVLADMSYDDDVRSLINKTVARLGRLDGPLTLSGRLRVGLAGLQKADHSVAFVKWTSIGEPLCPCKVSTNLARATGFAGR